MRVIIADDSALIRERLQNIISNFIQVELVGSLTNGTDTLDAMRTLKPDLAIVDIKMPGLSGLEVLSEIRKEDQILKFIMLTFHSSNYYRQMATEAGADYFFSKVDDFEKVEVVIRNLLNKKLN
jgi:DNA-binding NarL/FixJ family response regulator